jgi:hypothetical protein
MAGRIAAVSVSEPKIPWRSAFCSPPMLHARSPRQNCDLEIRTAVFSFFYKEILANSSDSQLAYKFADDRRRPTVIIKE